MKQKSLRIFCAGVAAAMALSLFPVPGQAAAPRTGPEPVGQTETAARGTVLELPVRAKDGSLPESGAALLGLTEAGSGIIPHYPGTDYRHIDTYAAVYDPDDRALDGLPDAAELVVLDSTDHVVSAMPGNRVQAEPGDRQEEGGDAFHMWMEVTGLGALPAGGAYTLAFRQGETLFRTTIKLQVMEQTDRVIDQLYLEDFYQGAETARLRFTLLGFRTEAELNALSFELVDSRGQTAARAQAPHRIRESHPMNYERQMETELRLLPGAVFSEREDYALRIIFNHDTSLYNAFRAVERSPYSVSGKPMALTAADPGRGVVRVTLGLLQPETDYEVTVSSESGELLGRTRFTAGLGEEQKELTLTLTRQGMPVSLYSLPGGLTVELLTAGSIWPETGWFPNRYSGTDREVYYGVGPEYVAPVSGSIAFQFALEWEDPLRNDRNDNRLTLWDSAWTEVGRSGLFAFAEDWFQAAEVTLNRKLIEGEELSLLLNETPLGWIRVQSDYLEAYSQAGMQGGSMEFWANNGRFSLMMDGTTAGGVLEVRNEAGQAVTTLSTDDETCCWTEDLTGGAFRFSFTLTGNRLAKLTGGTKYRFVYRENGTEREYPLFKNGLFTYCNRPTPLTLEHIILNWEELNQGRTVTAVVDYNWADGLRNVTPDLAKQALESMVLTNTWRPEQAPIHMTVAPKEDPENRDRLLFDLTLPASPDPLPAGMYRAVIGDGQPDEFYITGPEYPILPELTRTHLYGWEDSWIGVRWLPRDAGSRTFTGRLYDMAGTELRSSVPMDWDPASSGLTFDPAAYDGLEPGSYTLRVLMGDLVLGDVSVELPHVLKEPVVYLGDMDDNWDDYGIPAIQSRDMMLYMPEQAGYGWYRFSETGSFEGVDYRPYIPDYGGRYTITGPGDGEKQLYLQLARTRTDPDPLQYDYVFWLQTGEPDFDLQVPAELDGELRPEGGQYVLTASIAQPGARVWAMFLTADGRAIPCQLQYDGMREGRAQFVLRCNGEADIWGPNGQRAEYGEICGLEFFLTDMTEYYDEETGVTGVRFGLPIHRDVRFAPPGQLDRLELQRLNDRGNADPADDVWEPVTGRVLEYRIPAGEGPVEADRFRTVACDQYGAPVQVNFWWDTEGMDCREEPDGELILLLNPYDERNGAMLWAHAWDEQGNEREAGVTLRLIRDRQAPLVTGIGLKPDPEQNRTVVTWTCADQDVREEFQINDQWPEITRKGDTFTAVLDGVCEQVWITARDRMDNESTTFFDANYHETLPPPDGLRVDELTSTGMMLVWNWGGDGPAVGFNVYRKGAGGTLELLGRTVNTDCHLPVQGLKADTAYTLVVKSRDGAGKESADGAELTVRTLAQTLALDSTAPAYGGDVGWIPLFGRVETAVGAVQLASAELIWRENHGGGWTGWQTRPLAVMNYPSHGDILDGLGELTEGSYEFRVSAEDLYGNKTETEIRSFTVGGAYVPAKPVLAELSADRDFYPADGRAEIDARIYGSSGAPLQVTVSWAGPDGVFKTLDRFADEPGRWGFHSTLELAGKPAGVYQVKVEAVDPACLEEITEQTVSFRLITQAPAQVTGLQLVSGVGSVTLSWTASEEPYLDFWRVFRIPADHPEWVDPERAELIGEVGEPRLETWARPGESCLYFVAAVDKAGGVSLPSEAVAGAARMEDGLWLTENSTEAGQNRTFWNFSRSPVDATVVLAGRSWEDQQLWVRVFELGPVADGESRTVTVPWDLLNQAGYVQIFVLDGGSSAPLPVRDWK